ECVLPDSKPRRGRRFLLLVLFLYDLLRSGTMEHRRNDWQRKSGDCTGCDVANVHIIFPMKRILVALTIVFVACSVRAEEIKDFGRDRLNGSPRHADWVDIKSGDRMIKAFVVYPERKDKAPIVIVISEIF